jgi:hypothetical protein
MQIDISIEDRRLLLQGIWKELTHYQGIIDRGEANVIALDHVNNMIKRLWALEDKLIGRA